MSESDERGRVPTSCLAGAYSASLRYECGLERMSKTKEGRIQSGVRLLEFSAMIPESPNRKVATELSKFAVNDLRIKLYSEMRSCDHDVELVQSKS